MSWGGPGRGRRSSFWTWLAFRSIIAAALAIVVAIIVNRTAMPKLTTEAPTAQSDLPLGLTGLVAHRGLLPLVPVPGLLLGIAALVLRPLRPLLAILATIGCVLAVVLILGTLVGALAPLYQAPAELG